MSNDDEKNRYRAQIVVKIYSIILHSPPVKV
jgi:hypothetical protein